MSQVASEFGANEEVQQAARAFQQVAVDTLPASSLYLAVAAVHGAGQYQLRPDCRLPDAVFRVDAREYAVRLACRHSAQWYGRNAESKIRSKRRDQGGARTMVDSP